MMSVYSRKIGEYSTVQKHTIVISENGSLSDVSVQSSVLPRPLDFPPYGLRIWFQLVSPYTVHEMRMYVNIAAIILLFVDETQTRGHEERD